MDYPDTHHCFLCGDQNPIGFKLKFKQENGDTISETAIPSQYQGFDGVVHGGIIATFLDEIMAQAVKKSGQRAMTGTLTVKYRKPCRTEKQIQMRGRIIEISGRIIKSQGEIIQDQEVVAEGEGIFIVPKYTEAINS